MANAKSHDMGFLPSKKRERPDGHPHHIIKVKSVSI